MRRWFLSYHSPDQGLAERLKVALERKDKDSHVFFAPSSLRAGGFWSRALAEEIAQADAFILLVGEKGVGAWQELEYDEALDKRVKFPDFPIILVLQGRPRPDCHSCADCTGSSPLTRHPNRMWVGCSMRRLMPAQG